MFDFLYTAVSWVLLRWHDLITALGADPAGGLGWALSIAAVVVTLRGLLLPLFARHGNSASRSFAGCLPVIVSAPIFLALLHVLRHVSNSVALCASADTGSLVRLYSFSPVQTCHMAQAKLFGAPLAGTLAHPASLAAIAVVVAVAAVGVLAVVGTQSLAVSRSVIAPVGGAATVQRVVRFVGPTSVLVSAAVLPLGLVIYLTTTNVWTLAHQVYLHR